MGNFTRRRSGGKDASEPPLLDMWPPLPPLDRLQPEHAAYVLEKAHALGVTVADRADVVQEVLYQAHRSRRSPIDERLLLFVITRRVVWRWGRRERRWQRGLAAAEALAVHDPGPVDEERAMEARDRAEAVHAAIEELPPLFREVFVLTALEGLTMTEIAARLRIPVGTGHARLRRAKGLFLTFILRQMQRRGLGEGDL